MNVVNTVSIELTAPHYFTHRDDTNHLKYLLVKKLIFKKYVILKTLFL